MENRLAYFHKHSRVFYAVLLLFTGLGPASGQDEFRAPTRLWAVGAISAELQAIEPGAGEDAIGAADTALPKLARSGSHLGSFGSVAISAKRLAMLPKWRRVTGKDHTALFTDDCKQSGTEGCATPFAKRLREVRRAAMGGSPLQQLRAVDAAVDAALPYKADRSNWGRGDHWATPQEIATRGAGDCEDYAVAKLWLLRSLGFTADQLQLVVLRDSRRGLYHAVLVAHVEGKRYVLDNLSRDVRTDDAFPSYLPIVSFAGGKSYIHGFEGQRSDIAQMPADLSAVSPGIGD
jgi:predicted transglutaminase-like cysteine proteinase